MAKLSANGHEVARFEVVSGEGEDQVIRQYSLRDNHWVLVKTFIPEGEYTRKGWTGWVRYGKYDRKRDTMNLVQVLERALSHKGIVRQLKTRVY